VQVSMFEMMYPTFKFNKKEITVLETFAGIGSQRKALDRIAERKNIDFNYLPPVEFDKYAMASYNAIHETNHETKDITKTYGTEYEKIDIFTYSFPCQDISLAGNQKGFSRDSNTRSGLLWEVERILKEMKYKPKVLLMENVKNLISEKFIDDFVEWQRELENMGYMNYWEVLNAKDYGIPQNRERVFMVSILGEYNYNFPQPFPLKLRLKDMLEDEVDEKYYLSEKMISFFTENTIKMQEKGNGFKFLSIEKESAETAKSITTKNGSRMDDNFILDRCLQVGELDIKGNEQIKRVYSDAGLCPTLTNMQGGNRQPKILVNKTLCLNSKVNGKQPSLQDRIYDTNGISTAITTSFMPSILQLPRGNNKGNNFKECPTITSNSWQYNNFLNNGLRIRKLTPLECFRLMGFDDEDYYKAAKVNSNTQLYKQCGNSIVVNVLEAIFEKLF